MALKDVLPGTYRAKAVNGVWTNVGQKQTPAVGVTFEFSHDGKMETIQHVMYLTQTALQDGSTVSEKTFDTLAVLGYNETIALENGIITKAHLADKEVEIVIDYEIDRNDPTKRYTKVKWVNELGGSRLAGMPVQQVLGNMNLRSEMAAARARKGQKATQSQPQQVTMPLNGNVPF